MRNSILGWFGVFAFLMTLESADVLAKNKGSFKDSKPVKKKVVVIGGGTKSSESKPPKLPSKDKPSSASSGGAQVLSSAPDGYLLFKGSTCTQCGDGYAALDEVKDCIKQCSAQKTKCTAIVVDADGSCSLISKEFSEDPSLVSKKGGALLLKESLIAGKASAPAVAKKEDEKPAPAPSQVPQAEKKGEEAPKEEAEVSGLAVIKSNYVGLVAIVDKSATQCSDALFEGAQKKVKAVFTKIGTAVSSHDWTGIQDQFLVLGDLMKDISDTGASGNGASLSACFSGSGASFVNSIKSTSPSPDKAFRSLSLYGLKVSAFTGAAQNAVSKAFDGKSRPEIKAKVEDFQKAAIAWVTEPGAAGMFTCNDKSFHVALDGVNKKFNEGLSAYFSGSNGFTTSSTAKIATWLKALRDLETKLRSDSSLASCFSSRSAWSPNSLKPGAILIKASTGCSTSEDSNGYSFYKKGVASQVELKKLESPKGTPQSANQLPADYISESSFGKFFDDVGKLMADIVATGCTNQ
jgi:hypothetical protein